jgi:hypothetical protein
MGQQADRIRAINENGWYMYFGDHHVSGRWGVHLEGQWRRSNVITNWQQLLLRPGVNYDLNEAVMLTAGYAFIDTWPYGGAPAPNRFPEHRFFQQALVRQRIGRTQTSHRYRLEQRLLGETQREADGSVNVNRYRYENRFRYMFRANVPLRGRTIEKGDWYVGLYNEFFVNFGRNVASNIFDQNRAYAALGYKLGEVGNLEVGYMQQTLLQRSGRVLEYNHTFQVGVYSNLPFKRR